MDHIVDFIIDRMPWHKGQEDLIKKLVAKHIEYGTFDYEEDHKGIVYCLRYNISPSGKIADVIDLCVRKKEPSGVIKYLIAKNMQRWPSLEVIRFVREKYNDRGRTYKLSDILKKELKWVVQK